MLVKDADAQSLSLSLSLSFKPSEISDKCAFCMVQQTWCIPADQLQIMRPFTGIPLIGDVVTLSVKRMMCVCMLCSHIEAHLHTLANYQSGNHPIRKRREEFTLKTIAANRLPVFPGNRTCIVSCKLYCTSNCHANAT